ncbi:hypothetical protein [Listeria aquatica]|uniref:Uncharacterized protein n=1 Tax=Listeria aquatica FSL S10-1188 TaxID=1265818 RepID=W7B9C9_9LIST|nr:hypothetical protein [Listeria aquatica]EUJ16518.1 hypothetical protein MAQA_16046 [Listeria aquatica FSL S10-1188]
MENLTEGQLLSKEMDELNKELLCEMEMWKNRDPYDNGLSTTLLLNKLKKMHELERKEYNLKKIKRESGPNGRLAI